MKQIIGLTMLAVPFGSMILLMLYSVFADYPLAASFGVGVSVYIFIACYLIACD
jgi:hypothetical protein